MNRFTLRARTAKVGIPMIMPTIPQRPPKNRMENRTQKLETPVVWLMIFGPRMFPSNCWRIRIKTRNLSISTGETRSRMNALGIAPIKGPKYGMTFVRPTNTLITSA